MSGELPFTGFVVPGGGGTSVSNPANFPNSLPAADNAVIRSDGTTGGLQGSGVFIGDTGQVSAPAGDAANPAYTFVGDLNTGMFLESTDTLSFSAGGNRLINLTNDNGLRSIGSPIQGFRRFLEQSSAGSGSPNILTAAETLVIFTNEGSAAENYHTLPSAEPGQQFTFVVQDADGIRITATAGDTIQPIAGTAASASGGFIRCATIGAFITLLAVNVTEWIAIGSAGTWTIDV